MATRKQRTRTAIRRHGDKIAKNTLRLFDKLVQAADAPNATKEDIKTAVSFGIDIFPYIMPKLTAIAPGVLDADGHIIAPDRVAQLIDIARQAQAQDAPLMLDQSDCAATVDAETTVLSDATADAPGTEDQK